MSPVPLPARPADASRGFTLLELMFAFAIMALVVVPLVEVQNRSIEKGGKALNLRDVRVMADTVFRRIVYEYWLWDDGMRGTADEWYADFAGVPAGPQRDRWKIYRLELTKRKGLVAGTDPDGKLGSLFDDTNSTGTASPTQSTGSPSTPADPNDATTAGESAYMVELKVFTEDSETPEITLRSIVPVPESEREVPK